MQKYYISQGYFEATVTDSVSQLKEKQLGVEYDITTNNQYYIDTISTEIESYVLDSIYQASIENSKIKKGNPFVFNDFVLEESRLISLYRNTGIYHFEGNIGFYTDSIKTRKHIM